MYSREGLEHLWWSFKHIGPGRSREIASDVALQSRHARAVGYTLFSPHLARASHYVGLFTHSLTRPRSRRRVRVARVVRTVRSSASEREICRARARPRAPARAGGAPSRPRRARARRECRCGTQTPRAAVGVAAARAPQAPLSVDAPRPARSARGTARGSGTARDPGRVGRRHRTVAPAARPGHHRAARRCRRARPVAPHGPGRRSTPRGGAPGREARRSGPVFASVSRHSPSLQKAGW